MPRYPIAAFCFGVTTFMFDRASTRLLAFPLLVCLLVVLVSFTYTTNRVQGVVVDGESGLPLAGSRVQLPDGRLLRTNEAGRFSLPTPRGILPIQIQAPAYHPLDTFCDASDFSISDVACRAELQPRKLTVWVADALDDSIAIDGLSVQANGIYLKPAEDGRYVGKRIAPPIEIIVDAAGYLPWAGEGDYDQPVDVRLQPTRLSGIARASDRADALAGVYVEVLDRIVETDEAGRFEFLRLAGPVQLRARLAGYRDYRGPLISEDALTAGDVVDLPLEPLFSPGRVIDVQSGRPVAGATISTPDQTITAGADGAFRLRAILPQTPITARADDYFDAHLDYTGQDELIVSLQSQITALVVRDDHSRHPLEAAEIETALGSALTDADGRATLRGLQPGQDIVVQAGHYFSHTFSYSGQASTVISLKQIRADVVVSDGMTQLPIAGAIVRTAAGDFVADAEGRCTAVGLLPGHSVTVEADNHRPISLTYGGENPLVVQLRPKQVLFHVVDADSGESIPGIQVKQDGAPLWPNAARQYTIADWDSAPGFSFRAAGYRRYAFPLTALGLNDAGDSTTPTLHISADSTGIHPVLRLEIPSFTVRAIYVPFGLLTRPDIIESLFTLVQTTELNAMVIDMKGDRGNLGFRSQTPLALELGVNRRDIMNIDELLQRCREAGIYTIARQVVFKDHPLSTAKPEWAAVTGEGEVWLDREGLGWANPFLQEVRDYNIALAVEIAALGFDEIQFDYLRFPSDGDVSQIVYQQEHTPATRTAAITTFVEQITEALRPYGIFTSADLFGLTIWVTPDEDMGIGQRVKDIAPLVDYLCPMVYPSTFGPGNLGYENPNDYPYDVVFRSVIQASGRVPATTRVRPWLQAYWYTLDEYLLQKQAAIDSMASGWSFWNARGQYMPGLFEAE
jgi:hypothetical protein